MSLPEKVGQVIAIYSYADYSSASDPDLLLRTQQIRDFHIGSVVLGSRVISGDIQKASFNQLSLTTTTLQKSAQIPLLICADLERGLIARVKEAPDFPAAMAVAATGQPHNMRLIAQATAADAEMAGINFSLAPVADTDELHGQSGLGVRVFSDDPQTVANFVEQYIKGAHEEHMLTAVKHFPGSGDSTGDTHFKIVTIRKSRSDLENGAIIPFKRAISSGVDAVMLEHARVPAIDPDPTHVATVSPALIDYLRRDLGFQGAVMTDAVGMSGLTKLYPHQDKPTVSASIDALKAGADLILMPPDLSATVSGLISAVKSGAIPAQRLDDAVKHVLAMKQTIAGATNKRGLSVSGPYPRDESARNLAQSIADQSILRARNMDHLFPIASTAGKNLLAVVFKDSPSSPLGNSFVDQLKTQFPYATVRYLYANGVATWENANLLDDADAAKIIATAVFVTSEGVPSINQVGALSRDRLRTAQQLQVLISQHNAKNIVIAFGEPYIIPAEYPAVRNYICAFSLSSTSERSAAKLLAGTLQNNAISPVSLPIYSDNNAARHFSH